MDRQSERYLAAVCLRGRPGRLRAGALLCALALALAAGVSLAGSGALSTRGAAARAAVALPKAPPALPAQVSLPAEGIYQAPYRTREEGEGRPDPARLTLPGRRGKALL